MTYAWADDLAWTVSVVTGRDRIDVIRAYGADPDQEPVMMTFEDARVAEEDLGVFSLVQVRLEGFHILMIENIGWRGRGGEVIERRHRASLHQRASLPHEVGRIGEST